MQPLFWPGLERPFPRPGELACAAARQRRACSASLLKVFLPYLVWNTVFDNRRVVAEMGRAPRRFSNYCFPLLRFARENHFRYPYRAWPETAIARIAQWPRSAGGAAS